MKKVLLFVVLLFCSSELLAQEDLYKAVIPEANSLKPSKKFNNTNNPHGSVRQFKGNLWLTGQLTGEWIKGVDEAEANTLSVKLIVDPEHVKKLPYIQVLSDKGVSAYKQDNGLIFLLNPKEALHLAFKGNLLKEFMQKKIQKIQINGNFLVSDYEMSIECDALHSAAKLIKNEKMKSTEAQAHAGC